MRSKAALLCVCALACSAGAETAFSPDADLQAAVQALPARPGLWAIQTADVAGAPLAKCITREDWDNTKRRALGLAKVPEGCTVREVILRGALVRTTFACGEFSLMEEIEFGESAFHMRAVEMPPLLTKGVVLRESSGTYRGPC